MLVNSLTPSNIDFSKAILESVNASNRRYKNKLQEIRHVQNKEIKSCKRKQSLQQIDEITKKKSLQLTSVEKDIKHPDKLSAQAEAEKDFSILHMSTSQFYKQT